MACRGKGFTYNSLLSNNSMNLIKPFQHPLKVLATLESNGQLKALLNVNGLILSDSALGNMTLRRAGRMAGAWYPGLIPGSRIKAEQESQFHEAVLWLIYMKLTCTHTHI